MEGWALQKARRIKAGEKREPWESIKWYGTLDNALKGVTQLKIRLSDAEGILACTNEIRRIGQEVSEALKAAERDL